jgi:hypothetical protein
VFRSDGTPVSFGCRDRRTKFAGRRARAAIGPLDERLRDPDVDIRRSADEAIKAIQSDDP